MAKPRTFDHDEARRRWLAGETTAALAREYGVSRQGLRYAVDPKTKRVMDAYSRRYVLDRRTACRGGCGRLVWTYGYGTSRSGYCRKCLGERRNIVRHGTETEYRQGCRCEPCRLAASEAKRRRRELSRVPCSHGCGTLVDGINRRNPHKPPECHACAMKRVHGTLEKPLQNA